jgi:Ca-activated chloride channel family protein
MPGNWPDHYTVLGLPKDATPEEIRRAYFELARQLHPDANPDPLNREKFLVVQAAYEVLSNRRKRVAYDAQLPQDDITSSIEIRTIFSSSGPVRSAKPQLFYALTHITCKANPDRSLLPPLFICMVIDRSTSMQGARMEMVKENILRLMRSFQPKDVFCAISFSDRAQIIVPPTRASDLQKMEQYIRGIQTGGATEIYQGISMGVSQLMTGMGKKMLQHLILVTDGQTYGDEDQCLALAREIEPEGIPISCMGIGHDWNDTFLDKLAGISGENAWLINTSEDVRKFLERRIASLGTLFARGVRFDFEIPAEITARYIYRLVPDVSALETLSPMMLGDLGYGKEIVILTEFYIENTQALDKISLLNGKIKMVIPSQQAGIFRVPVEWTLNILEKPDPAGPNNEIVEAVSRISLYQLQEKARKEVSAGDVRNATRHLQNLATNLLSQGENELARTVLAEAAQIAQNNSFSKTGEKQIKYGTRALLLPPDLKGGS